MAYETEKLESKFIATSDSYKEVVAFANMGGGSILLGINEGGESMSHFSIL
jgi:predicted HTH transcriptional regulator